MNVDHEVELLQQEIKRLGEANDDGSYTVTFGVLFKGIVNYIAISVARAHFVTCIVTWHMITLGSSDDKCANLFEAIVGTLRAAKRRKLVSYEGQYSLYK